MKPTLNERIIQTLEAATPDGLTHEQLAERLGVPVWKIRRNQRKHAGTCTVPGHPPRTHLHDDDAPTLAKTGQ